MKPAKPTQQKRSTGTTVKMSPTKKLKLTLRDIESNFVKTSTQVILFNFISSL